MFKGGHIPQNFMEVYSKYADYIRLYLFCCDRENGTISVNPIEVLGWPYRFFLVMTMIKNEYVSFINESQKKSMEKAKQGKGRRRGRV